MLDGATASRVIVCHRTRVGRAGGLTANGRTGGNSFGAKTTVSLCISGEQIGTHGKAIKWPIPETKMPYYFSQKHLSKYQINLVVPKALIVAIKNDFWGVNFCGPRPPSEYAPIFFLQSYELVRPESISNGFFEPPNSAKSFASYVSAKSQSVFDRSVSREHTTDFDRPCC